MYVFWCGSDSKVRKLEKGKTLEGPFAVHDSLANINPACDKNILVLYKSLTGASPRKGKVDSIKPKDVINVRPFRPIRLIRAGGGYVFRIKNDEPQILLIKRRGVWDLPKGKCDKGESIEDCAVREVCEEVGIKKAEIVEQLGATFHTYDHKGFLVVKETRWFLMSTKAKNFVPEEAEQIEKVKFFPLSRVKKKVAYVNLIDHASEWEETIRDALLEGSLA